MNDFVLDASALLALVHGEPGAERVRAVLGRAAISAINLAEVVGRLSERGGASGDIRRGLDRLRLTVLPVDEELGYAAGFLRPRHAVSAFLSATGSASRSPHGSARRRSPPIAPGQRVVTDARIELLRPA